MRQCQAYSTPRVGASSVAAALPVCPPGVEAITCAGLQRCSLALAAAASPQCQGVPHSLEARQKRRRFSDHGRGCQWGRIRDACRRHAHSCCTVLGIKHPVGGAHLPEVSASVSQAASKRLRQDSDTIIIIITEQLSGSWHQLPKRWFRCRMQGVWMPAMQQYSASTSTRCP